MQQISVFSVSGDAKGNRIPYPVGRSPLDLSLAQCVAALEVLNRAYARGEISEQEWERRSLEVEDRRAALKGLEAKPRSGPKWVPNSYFPRREVGRDYGREQARDRVRSAARAQWVPDLIANRYTDGELAALSVVAEYGDDFRLDWPLDKIAAKAGVSRRTVQNAYRKARDNGHVEILERRQYKAASLPNVVRITSKEWRDWISKRPASWRTFKRRGGGCKSLHTKTPTENKPPLTPPKQPDRAEPLALPRVPEVARPGAEPSRLDQACAAFLKIAKERVSDE